MPRQHSAPLAPGRVSSRTRFAATASLVVAALAALAALGGILNPAIYARETLSMRTQGIGQDWATLLVAVPWLAITALLVLRGARRARLLLASGLAYTTYSYVMYALDVHFNVLFLVYCAVLGLSVFALVALATELPRVRGFDRRVPHRVVGGFEMAFAVAFALLWLSEILPALLSGTDPEGLDEAGLFTNPVHVLDLAFVLPALFVAGWLLWHRRSGGYVLTPIALGFVLLMGVALAGMAVAMYTWDVVDGLAVAVGAGVLAAISAALLVAMFRLHPAVTASA